MEYHSYGNGHLQVFNCSVSSGVHRGWTISDDHIFVFLNYKQLGKFKDKASARKLLEKLIKECPYECRKDFEQHADEILEVVK